MAKRAVDVTLALAGLAVISPLLILLAWLIRRESAGPAFYLQRRLGLNGREFTIVKLRTMRSDAEIGRGATWAVDGDPRCTPLGARLRGFGIDELPQLGNVLKGEMSLIGPRPERPEFHAIFKQRFPGYERRLAVRSGITGWAQVHGWRGDTSLKERVRCDLEYVDRWTIWRDLAILARTPLSVLRQRRKGVSPPVRSDDEGSNRAIGQARNSFLPPRGCAPGDSEQRILS